MTLAGIQAWHLKEIEQQRRNQHNCPTRSITQAAASFCTV
jgi:hypothetical protein